MATFIFDFDDTLFDTKRLRQEVSDKIAVHGISEEFIEEAYRESKKLHGNYSLDSHIEILKKQYNFQEHITFYKWFDSIDFSTYIFPEAVDLLEKLSKDNYLVLLTKGLSEFQNIKVQGSNIMKYFNEIHITPDAKEVFLQDKKFNTPIYFINDKESENEKVKKAFPDFDVGNDFRIFLN